MKILDKQAQFELMTDSIFRVYSAHLTYKHVIHNAKPNHVRVEYRSEEIDYSRVITLEQWIWLVQVMHNQLRRVNKSNLGDWMIDICDYIAQNPTISWVYKDGISYEQFLEWYLNSEPNLLGT